QLEAVVHTKFQTIVGKPVDTKQIEALVADIRADGRYDADYTVGYDDKQSNRPIILVAVNDKKTGPPFLDVGFNLQAQTGGGTPAPLGPILKQQCSGGF